MRWLTIVLAAFASVQAATLEHLSLDDLISKSNVIVRARVVSSRSAFRGPVSPSGMIYTFYRLQPTEQWKGSSVPAEIAVPGGEAQGLRLTIAGAPVLQAGQEYVFFIWVSRSGLAQVIGLTQGLFSIHQLGNGKVVLSQMSTTETILDPVTKKAVSGAGAQYEYGQLKSMVAGGGGNR